MMDTMLLRPSLHFTTLVDTSLQTFFSLLSVLYNILQDNWKSGLVNMQPSVTWIVSVKQFNKHNMSAEHNMAGY